MSDKKLPYQRIVLKLSGEALLGDADYGIDPKVIYRIASEVRQVVELDFSLRYRPAGSTQLSTDTLPEYHELTPGECDVEQLDDQGRIDLISFSRDQIYLALPLQPRCRENCRGLCSQCGTDLNTATCACAIRPPDPRLAALAELRKRF